MFTPQDVQDKKFAKAVFGGYDMSEVDEFLDQLGNDYEKLVSESAVLKSKLKTLAEKVEEYRSVDEDMRKTLFATKRASDEQIAEAQNRASVIVDEARLESDRLLSDAKRQSEQMISSARARAEERLAELNTLILAEEGKLSRAKDEMRGYAAVSADACRRQLETLKNIIENAGAPSSRVSRTDIPAPTEPRSAVNVDVHYEAETIAMEAERITQPETAEQPEIVVNNVDIDNASSSEDDFRGLFAPKE